MNGMSGEVEIFRIIHSTQSTCYFLHHGNGTKLVVKHFKNKYINATLNDANKEFEALLLFHKACSTHPYIQTACPLMLFPAGDGYVMKELQGLGLDKVLECSKNSRVNLSKIAERIIEGVKVFHECTLEPYADFQPQNILIDSNNLVGFIDPTLPNQFFYKIVEETPNGLLAADLGYWVYNTSAIIVKQGICRPRWVYKLIRFTILLLTNTHCSDKSETKKFLSAVFKAANQHSSRLKLSRQVKPSILWLAIRPCLWALRLACQRESSQ